MTSDIQHISAPDGKNIYYYLDNAQPAESKQLIIIGHGMTGHPNEYLHQTAYRYFTNCGFDVCRISFYDTQENARALRECTLAVHASDLNHVVRNLSSSYENIFYAGHSYGGLTGLIANPDVTATTFWDSTYIPDLWDTISSYVPELDCYKINWETEILVSKEMIEEAAQLTYEKIKEYAEIFKSPALVALAGENPRLLKQGKQLTADLKVPTQQTIIKGADHCFYNKNTAQELATQTAVWFQKHI